MVSRWLGAISEAFLQNKPAWYTILSKCHDKEAAYRRMDSFFNSIARLMSNQLWVLTENSLVQLETFFGQFQHADSSVSLFKVRLDILSNRIRFNPSLSEMENIIVSIVEELVISLQSVPRIESRLFTTVKDPSGFHLVNMSMESSRINQGQYLRTIVTRNIIGAQKHVLNYDRYKMLLSQLYEKKIQEFLELPRKLEEYESEIKKLKDLIEDIDSNANKVYLSMIYLDCEELNGGLKDRAQALIQKIIDTVAETNRRNNTKYLLSIIIRYLIWLGSARRTNPSPQTP